MTVLQFSTMVPPTAYGGAERVVDRLATELEAAGLEVHNAGLGPARGPGESANHPIRNLYWPFDGRSHGVVARTAWHLVDSLLLTARRQVEAIFDEVAPTVVVTHNLRGWGLAPWVVAAARGVPIVQVIHDYGLICNSSTLWRGTPCEGICTGCRPRALATRRRWPGGQVVGVSQAVLAAHAERGVELASVAGVSPPTAAAAETRPRAGSRTSGGIERVGFIGRVTPAKGLALLLDAVAGSPLQLVVAGDGNDDVVGELRTASPPNVTWLGWVDTPDEFFDQIDLLVVPSAWPEPFGLVVVEAARAGLPVLIADQPGLVEAAQVSQARYATFTANDRDALAKALELPIDRYQVRPPQHATIDLTALVISVAGGARRSGSNAQVS